MRRRLFSGSQVKSEQRILHSPRWCARASTPLRRSRADPELALPEDVCLQSSNCSLAVLCAGIEVFVAVGQKQRAVHDSCCKQFPSISSREGPFPCRLSEASCMVQCMVIISVVFAWGMEETNHSAKQDKVTRRVARSFAMCDSYRPCPTPIAVPVNAALLSTVLGKL